MPEIVGEWEIAARLHVDESVVRDWASGDLLPPRDGLVAGFPAWQWVTVRDWANRTGRLGLEGAVLKLLRQGAGPWDLPTLRHALADGGMFTAVDPAQLTTTLEDLLEAELVARMPGDRWSLALQPMY
jgi:hypothetical protein